MPLLFVDQAVERGKRLGPEERIGEFQSWFTSVADEEHWDVRLQFASKAAFERASSLLGVPPDPYLILMASPRDEDARNIARHLVGDGRLGSVKIVAGDPSAPVFLTADFPPDTENELDRLPASLGPREAAPAPWRIAFWDHTRVSGAPSDGIRGAYQVAAEVMSSPIPFAEWWPGLFKSTDEAARARASGIDCSLFAREIPNMVGVDATRLSGDQRNKILEAWLTLLPSIFEIEAKGRFSGDTIKEMGLEAISAGKRSTSWRWEVDTISMAASVLRERVFQTFQDPTVIKGVRSWQLRASAIRWRVPDASIIDSGDWNAAVLAQAPREFRRTIRMTFALEDMESPRFLRAVDALRASVPAQIERETSWIPSGDPEESERGREQRVLWTRLEAACKDFMYRRGGGFLSEFVYPVRKAVVDETEHGAVEVKRALVDSLREEIPGFPFDPAWSMIGAAGSTEDRYTFVRRRPSGTQNFIMFDRERRPYYARSVWIRMGVSAVRGPIAAPWGLHIDTASLGWTEIPYLSQAVFDRALKKALKRLRAELIPLFDEVEPHLLALRPLARG